MKKIYTIMAMAIFIIIYLVGCDSVTSLLEDIEIVSDESSLAENIVSTAEGLAFVHEYGEYVYVCNENSIVRSSQDLAEKETIYTISEEFEQLGSPEYGYRRCYIESFLFADVLYICLLDFTVPHPWGQIVTVNLMDGTSDFFEEDDRYWSAFPDKVGDSILYRKGLKTEGYSLVRRDKSDNYEKEVEVLQNVSYASYNNDGYVYYRPLSDENVLYRCDLSGNNVESGSHVEKAYNEWGNKNREDYRKKSDIAKSLLDCVPEMNEIPDSLYKFPYNPYGVNEKCFTQDYVYYRRIIEDSENVLKMEIYRQNLDSGVMERVL